MKDLAKKQLENYLRQKGLNPAKFFSCLNPEHADKNPSMSFDRRRNKVHCFACGVDWDIFDIVKAEFNLSDPVDFFKKTYQILALEFPPQIFPSGKQKDFLKTTTAGVSLLGQDREVKVFKLGPAPLRLGAVGLQKYIDWAKNNLHFSDYPQKRGLSAATCARFNLGFDPAFKAGKENWAALIIPTGAESFTARNTDSKADKDKRIRKTGASPVFNAELLWADTASPVVVVEGEIDALCVAEAGGSAVALGSTANVGSFLQLLKLKLPQRPLALALDNDDEGRRAARKLAEGLESLQVRFFEPGLYGNLKDAGEALVGDSRAFHEAVLALNSFEIQVAETEKEIYLNSCAAQHLSSFKGFIGKQVNTPAQPTGFALLDVVLDGGLYEGLYIIGGISSLGKTTLISQLADQLAKNGREVLIFSLEMARSELMAKSISRLSLLAALENGLSSAAAKTARGITSAARYQHYSDAELKLIGQAIEEYEKYADKLFISEGIGDIGAGQVRREVEKHCRVTGRSPVVVVDYLQILAPASERATDKQNIDKNVLELKRLSRDYKIPVLGLSSFNRANYREAVTMEAFKESGAIEYSSDVLMGLQLKGAGEKDFDALSEKEKNPRRVELVVLKNRQGPAGKTVDFEYYPMFNYFKEV